MMICIRRIFVICISITVDFGIRMYIRIYICMNISSSITITMSISVRRSIRIQVSFNNSSLSKNFQICITTNTNIKINSRRDINLGIRVSVMLA